MRIVLFLQWLLTPFLRNYSVYFSKLFQIQHVVRLSALIQRLQEERAAVALNMYINRTSSLDTLDDLQKYVDINGINMTKFSYRKVKFSILLRLYARYILL